MSGGMPELGSRISLISKADIRYEGRLFTVDPQECTIALAGVQSFGTEDRETPCPIAPQSQIYEYILFRGSDIKDIRVINNCTIPNDPAIMQMHLQIQQPQLIPTPFHNSNFNVNPGGGQKLPYNAQPGFSNSNAGSNLSIESVSKQRRYPETQENIDPLLDDKGTSRPTTPARKTPITDISNQASSSKPQKHLNTQNLQKPDNRLKPGNAVDMAGQRARVHEPPKGFNPQQQRPQNRPPWMNNRNSFQNNRNRFRGRMVQGQNNPTVRTPANRGRNVLKFDNDYDFEQANNKFEELRSQLAKVKLSEDVKPQVNGDVETPETIEKEIILGEPEPDFEEVGYDKAKSFFDNISCEAMERSKGKSQRTDWRHEKKLNTETFGVALNRRNNYRSRGSAFNRNYNNRNNMREDFRSQGMNRLNPKFNPVNRSQDVDSANKKV